MEINEHSYIYKTYKVGLLIYLLHASQPPAVTKSAKITFKNPRQGEQNL